MSVELLGQQRLFSEGRRRPPCRRQQEEVGGTSGNRSARTRSNFKRRRRQRPFCFSGDTRREGTHQYVALFVSCFLLILNNMPSSPIISAVAVLDAVATSRSIHHRNHRHQQPPRREIQLPPPPLPTTIVPLIPHEVQVERVRNRRRLLDGGRRRTGRFRRSSATEDFFDDDMHGGANGTNWTRSIERARYLQKYPVASLFQGYGTHYVDIYCGTPPQRQTVIVDTGSEVTGFPCTGCVNCGAKNYHIDPLFAPERSSTFEVVQDCSRCLKGKCGAIDENDKKEGTSSEVNNGGVCQMKKYYRVGSGWKAREVRDYCYLGGWHDKPAPVRDAPSTGSEEPVDGLDPANAGAFRFPLQFACQSSVSGAFKTQLADGIMGMQPAKASLWRQVYEQYQNVTASGSQNGQNLQFMSEPSFSLCYSVGDGDQSKLRKGVRAGLLTLGGVDSRVHANSKMVYSRFGDDRSSGYFPVVVRKMYLRPAASGRRVSENNNSTSNPLGNIPNPIRLGISEAVMNEELVTIDSGSTDTYFTKKLAVPFQKVWTKLVGSPFDPRKPLTKEQMDALPTIILQLKGEYEYNDAILKEESESKIQSSMLARDIDPKHPYDVKLEMMPHHYYEYNPSRDEYVARLHFDPKISSALGASSMMGYNIFFDSGRYRIGWAKSNCDYDSIIDAEVGQRKHEVGSGADVALKGVQQDEKVGTEAFEDSGHLSSPSQVAIHETSVDEMAAAIESDSSWNVCSSRHCQTSLSLILLMAISLLVMLGAARRRKKRRKSGGFSLFDRSIWADSIKTAMSDERDNADIMSLDLFEDEEAGGLSKEASAHGNVDAEKEPLWGRRSSSDIVRRNNKG